jgi:multicomponent Na+:H+ antiporter subunit G
MIELITIVAWVSVFTGVFFYLSGSIGVLRFPTVLCRLHALTKADNVGLGLIMLGLSLLGGSTLFSVKALSVWLIVLLCSAASSTLIARHSEDAA